MGSKQEMPIIQLDHLTVRDRRTGALLLQIPHLEVKRGEAVAIAGPSGSGKSTLLRTLAFLTADNLSPEGTYLLEGRPARDMDPISLRRQVSYCFQNPLLFGETVADNLAFPYQIRGMAFDRDRALKRLVQSGLSEAYLYKAVSRLSGGERQRVALIRNLLILPKLLVLDEITSSLDEETGRSIMNWLWDWRAREGLTFLLVSHRKEDRAMADREFSLSPTTKEA